MLEELTRSLPDKPGMANVLNELAGCIASAVNADIQRLYLVEKRDGHVHAYDPEQQQVLSTYPIGPGTVLAAHVAATRQPLRASAPFIDSDKYPEGTGAQTVSANVCFLIVFRTVAKVWRVQRVFGNLNMYVWPLDFVYSSPAGRDVMPSGLYLLAY